MKVLLVEDDIKLGHATRELLRFENISADWAQDGSEGVQYFKETASGSYDVIVLDWMLPQLSGLDVCRILRRKYHFQGGIVFVTAKGEVDDCVRALEEGADDYVVKPFKIKELVARLKAVGRRKGRPFVDKLYGRDKIIINSDLKTVSSDNGSLTLRKKEFSLFELLFVNLNNVLPREVIFEKVWADKLDTNIESLESHVYTLRKKLRERFPEIKIKLVKNVGYMMEIENK